MTFFILILLLNSQKYQLRNFIYFEEFSFIFPFKLCPFFIYKKTILFGKNLNIFYQMILTEFLLKNKNSPINVKNNFTRLPTIFLHVYLRIAKKNKKNKS